jgi:hypothetical protein
MCNVPTAYALGELKSSVGMMPLGSTARSVVTIGAHFIAHKDRRHQIKGVSGLDVV